MKINDFNKLFIVFLLLLSTGCGIKNSPQDNQIEEIIYSFRSYPDNTTITNGQVYKMSTDGSNIINISNNDHFDSLPDVSHFDSKIVFLSDRQTGNDANKIFIMNPDGGNAVEVPNTQSATNPKWSKGPFTFIGFRKLFTQSSEIYRVNPDGSQLVQITFPESNESDNGGFDFLNEKFVVFSRHYGSSGNWDILMKYLWTQSEPIKLTDTDDIAEGIPAVSRDGKKLAFREIHVSQSPAIEKIIIAEIIDYELNVLQTIELPDQNNRNISGMDFSTDGTKLFVSFESEDIEISLGERKQEIFVVDIENESFTRLTNNTSLDIYPSSITAL